MEKLAEFIAKLKYPTIFIIVGATFVLLAAVQAVKIAGADIVPYNEVARIVLGVAGALFVAVAVYLILRGPGHGPPGAKRVLAYDVFLAAPMAGTETEKEYTEFRHLCLELLAELRSHAGVKTAYFVGEKLETTSSFESFEVAAEVDFEAIRQSAVFVMVYPRRMVSSVLCEAGFALAEGIPSVYFVRSERDLPYLLTKGGELPRATFPAVHIHTYDTPDDLKRIVRNNGARLFAK